VARPPDVALAEDAVVAEGGLCFAPGCREGLVELSRDADDAHAAPAAAGCRLDHEREPDLVRPALGDDRDACLPREPLCLELVAAGRERVGRRTDPGEPGRLDRCRELSALGEEAVTRVDRLGAGLLCRANVLVRVQVRRDLHGLVRRARMQRPGVIAGRDCERRDPELAARAEDAHCDLAAVGYQQLLDAHAERLIGGGMARVTGHPA
jgi:hypothetical protein